MKEELQDRFGVVPKSVENLLRISLIRVAAHKLYVTECKGKHEQIRVQLRPDAKLRVEGIPEFLALHGKKLKFVPGKNPCFVYRYKKIGKNSGKQKHIQKEQQRRVVNSVIEKTCIETCKV